MTNTSPIGQPGLAGELTHVLMSKLPDGDRSSSAVRGILDTTAARAVATPAPGVDTETDRTELLLPFAADVIARLALDSPWEAGVDGLVEDLSAALGRDADVVAVELDRASRNSSLMALAPATALTVQLRLAEAFARVDQISLWNLGSLGGITCIAHAETRRRRNARRCSSAERPSSRPATGARRAIAPRRLLAANGRGPVRTTGLHRDRWRRRS